MSLRLTDAFWRRLGNIVSRFDSDRRLSDTTFGEAATRNEEKAAYNRGPAIADARAIIRDGDLMGYKHNAIARSADRAISAIVGITMCASFFTLATWDGIQAAIYRKAHDRTT